LSKVKDNEMMLKAARENQLVMYKETPIRPSDFSAENLQARRRWHNIFKVLKGKNFQPRILYQARLSFRSEGRRNSFSDKQKLKELMINFKRSPLS